jgi:DNA invertase Pin-like site-specific DNA recombinase
MSRGDRELLRISRDVYQDCRPGKYGLFWCTNLVQVRPMKYGYARVSTDGRSVAAQVAELRAHGCGHVFREVASGAKSDRCALRRALDKLAAGDVFVVTCFDRLARSTRELLNILAVLIERKAGFRSLCDARADSTTPHWRLMLTVIGGLAEFARHLIRSRTSEGRARAVARGVRMGPKPKLTPHQMKEAIQPANVATRRCGRSRAELRC